jgi:uncharacterized protein (TIGR02996 family)
VADATTPKPIPDEQAALLTAIVAEPDEDTPRLVYADWLQEHGDEEQAQFIRESIAQPYAPGDDFEDMGWRLKEIAERKASDWLTAIGVTGFPYIPDRGWQHGYYCGMPDELCYERIDQFVENAATLFARVPVRSIQIEDISPSEGEWLSVTADLPGLLRLRELDLGSWPARGRPEGFPRLITSPHVANLEVLRVCSAALTDDDVQAFNEAEHLGNLEALSLSDNQITAIGALAIVRSPRMPRLQRLALGNNPIAGDWSIGSAYRDLVSEVQRRFGDTHALQFTHC